MTDTKHLSRLVSLLTADETPRVWSLLVTIFGDLVQPDESPISGRALGRITSAIGIRPEATRVALHRLRKDDWILSEKRGRESLYRLSPGGQRESRAARPRIYGPAPQRDQYSLVLTDPTEGQGSSQLVPVSDDLAIGRGPFEDPIVPVPLPDPLPDWMRSRLCPPDLVRASRDARAALENLSDNLTRAPSQPPLARAVLRGLVVHRWRRIVLRAPHLPDDLLPTDWQGAQCRILSHAALATLPRPALSELEMVEDGAI